MSTAKPSGKLYLQNRTFDCDCQLICVVMENVFSISIKIERKVTINGMKRDLNGLQSVREMRKVLRDSFIVKNNSASQIHGTVFDYTNLILNSLPLFVVVL